MQTSSMGVAASQSERPSSSADPHARAHAGRVLNSTGRPQGQGDGLVCAGTLPSDGYAARHLQVIHGLRIDAGETTGAVLVDVTDAAAERTLVTVSHACVVRARRRHTVARVSAGFAEVRVVGDADKYQVGLRAGHGLAGPPVRAFLGAGLGADPFAHVLYAPARLAVPVLVTRIEEAPLPRRTRGPRQLWLHV